MCSLFAHNMKKKPGSKARNLKIKEICWDVEKLDKAEERILKLVQKGAFNSDIKVIKRSYLNDTNQQYVPL